MLREAEVLNTGSRTACDQLRQEVLGRHTRNADPLFATQADRDHFINTLFNASNEFGGRFHILERNMGAAQVDLGPHRGDPRFQGALRLCDDILAAMRPISHHTTSLFAAARTFNRMKVHTPTLAYLQVLVPREFWPYLERRLEPPQVDFDRLYEFLDDQRRLTVRDVVEEVRQLLPAAATTPSPPPFSSTTPTSLSPPPQPFYYPAPMPPTPQTAPCPVATFQYPPVTAAPILPPIPAPFLAPPSVPSCPALPPVTIDEAAAILQALPPAWRQWMLTNSPTFASAAPNPSGPSNADLAPAGADETPAGGRQEHPEAIETRAYTAYYPRRS